MFRGRVSSKAHLSERALFEVLDDDVLVEESVAIGIAAQVDELRLLEVVRETDRLRVA